MPVPIRAAALIAAAVFNATSLHAAPSDSTLGVWLDHTGRGAVEIKPCGDKLCGHVVWVKSTADAKGCGRQIIGDAIAGGKVVHSGWIYSPEKRKRYNVELSPMADGRLKVLGYAGTKLFSKTMYWTPAAAGLERCDGTTTAAAPAVPAPVATAPANVASPKPKAPAGEVPQQAQAKPAAAAPAKTQQAVAPAAPSAAPSVAAQLRSPATEKTQTATAEPEAEAAEPDVATQESETDENGPPRRLAEILDQVLTKSGDGNCKLDLPWVKVKFRCEDN